MGIADSNGCLGTSRKKSYGEAYGGMFETWKPEESKETNILVTPEEAFMIKK